MNPMDISRFETLKASGNLPSPKGVALAIMRLTQKEDASMAEMARIIKSDPAFVGRLIKAANSMNASPGRPVVSVQEALVVLGMPAVRNLALGFSLLSQYKSGACKGFDYGSFWTASLVGGIALQALTLRTRLAQAEEAFSVGLLARVGELALATVYPEEYGGIVRSAAKNPEADLTGLEAERFALNHRQLTVAMLADWGLPGIFCDIVAGHETPEDGRYGEGSREYLLVQSLALSRQIAAMCIAAEATRPAHLPRLFQLGRLLSIDEEDLAPLCDAIVREWQGWAAILSVSAPEVSPFEELAKARSEEDAASATVPARLRVLVVDDERSMRMALRAMLEEAGYEVFEAADGQEGLRMALEMQPHMVVTDRIMPVLDGMALTRALRATRPAVLMASSMRPSMPLTRLRNCSGSWGSLLDRSDVSILMATSVPPSSSWMSRAMRSRSSSLAASRWEDSSASWALDSRSSTSVSLLCVMSDTMPSHCVSPVVTFRGAARRLIHFTPPSACRMRPSQFTCVASCADCRIAASSDWRSSSPMESKNSRTSWINASRASPIREATFSLT